MRFVTISLSLLCAACSSGPKSSQKETPRYDWGWTHGIAVEKLDSHPAFKSSSVWRFASETPYDRDRKESQLPKGVFKESLLFRVDTTYNGFQYKAGVTYWGLRAHVEGKNGKNPFVLPPQYQDLEAVSIQEVYFKDPGSELYQIKNLVTGEVRPSDVRRVLSYTFDYHHNGPKKLVQKFFEKANGDVIFASTQGREVGVLPPFDGNITSPFLIQPVVLLEEDFTNEIAIAIRHRTSEKAFYQAYTLLGEKIGDPIDLQKVKHFYHGRTAQQLIRVVVKTDEKEDLYMPLGPKGLLSHPFVLGLRPIVQPKETLPPFILKQGDMPTEYIWSFTAIKWKVENKIPGETSAWGVYSTAIYKNSQLGHIFEKEYSSAATGGLFKAYRLIQLPSVYEDRTALQTRMNTFSTFEVEMFDPPKSYSVVTPSVYLGQKHWVLEKKYGRVAASRKELEKVLAQRAQDLLKEKAASEANMASMRNQRAIKRQESERRQAAQDADRRAYYNSIVTNGPRSNDLSTFQYETEVYCQARGPRCQEFKQRANNWERSHNAAAEANNMKRIQSYTSGGSGQPTSGYKGSNTAETTARYNQAVRQSEEKNKMREFEQQLDRRIKEKQ